MLFGRLSRSRGPVQLLPPDPISRQHPGPPDDHQPVSLVAPDGNWPLATPPHHQCIGRVDDTCRRFGRPDIGQPAMQHPTPKRRMLRGNGFRAQHAIDHTVRIRLGRQLLEEIDVIAQDVGGTGQRGDHAAGQNVIEYRKYFPPDPHAREPRVVVMRIAVRRKAPLLAGGVGRRSSDAQ